MLLLSGVLLFAIVFIGQSRWAEIQGQSLFTQLEKTGNNQKAEIARQLAQFDDTGIRLLVRGLTSKEEATAQACREALAEQLSDWKTLDNAKASQRYLVVSQELAEIAKTGSPYARQLACDFAHRVQNDILNRGLEGQYVVSANCRKVVETWQSGQRDPTVPLKFDRKAGHETALASAGEPPRARVSGINVPYLVAQSSDRDINDRLRQLAEQNDESGDWPDDGFVEANNLPAQQKKPATSPRVGFYSLYSAAPTPTKNDRILIARDSRRNGSPFLTERLQRVATIDLPKLPTQDLMRLLNHDDLEISRQAEALLIKRDGFQEEHIRLAAKLYHPDSNVRKSLLTQLADDEQLETYSWLAELLKDPDQNVRLATAKAVYGQIPLDDETLGRLQTIMLSDDDQRIAALGQGIKTRISTGDRSRYRR